ncbi:tetratricopeptide repeat protein [Henriciella aquimarina]|uniref:tetratricopeptide repeat protein n=1 Tax=Henriciella aquimarina TaxID=545261 RepID=UPI0009FE3A87|nr:tetratricopeptide repeat protein [Henriciella aquimarina]
MKLPLMSAAAVVALSLASCASQQASSDLSASEEAAVDARKQEVLGALSAYGGVYDVSDAAMATAVLGEDGKPVGLLAYESPVDAIKAGDMAAFIASVKTNASRDGETSPFASIVMSIDAAAAEDPQRAIETLQPALDSDEMSLLGGFLKAWYLAQEGDFDAAIDAHRDVGARLPGLTGDLSLAAMLEVAGREQEALAVYSAITPSEIQAPEHEFDPQTLLYGHVKLVIARQALLLRKVGRIEDAKALYQRLAEAEPEETASYAAAINQIETGRGLDKEPLDVDGAFARSLSDYSLALSYQRLIRSAFIGERLRGFDDTKSAFDQLALLIDPDNSDLRLQIVGELYDETLFEASAHLVEVAPEQTAGLQLALAQSQVRLGNDTQARKTLDKAIKLAKEDEELGTYSTAMMIYALLDDEKKATDLAEVTPTLAVTDAEKANAHGTSSAIYSQFGQFDQALHHARVARQLDDTHDRRMALAQALAEADEVDEALQLIRNEALTRPNDPYMLNTLGYFLVEHTDQYKEAYRVLARANSLAPTDPYISDSYGWARFKLGDLEGAKRYIEQARRELAPNTHWEIEDHLGDIYWYLDNPSAARDAWQTALEDYPSEDKRQAIQDKLDNGLEGPPPEKQALPDVSLENDGEVSRQDI